MLQPLTATNAGAVGVSTPAKAAKANPLWIVGAATAGGAALGLYFKNTTMAVVSAVSGTLGSMGLVWLGKRLGQAKESVIASTVPATQVHAPKDSSALAELRAVLPPEKHASLDAALHVVGRLADTKEHQGTRIMAMKSALQAFVDDIKSDYVKTAEHPNPKPTPAPLIVWAKEVDGFVNSLDAAEHHLPSDPYSDEDEEKDLGPLLTLKFPWKTWQTMLDGLARTSGMAPSTQFLMTAERGAQFFAETGDPQAREAVKTAVEAASSEIDATDVLSKLMPAIDDHSESGKRALNLFVDMLSLQQHEKQDRVMVLAERTSFMPNRLKPEGAGADWKFDPKRDITSAEKAWLFSPGYSASVDKLERLDALGKDDKGRDTSAKIALRGLGFWAEPTPQPPPGASIREKLDANGKNEAALKSNQLALWDYSGRGIPPIKFRIALKDIDVSVMKRASAKWPVPFLAKLKTLPPAELEGRLIAAGARKEKLEKLKGADGTYSAFFQQNETLEKALANLTEDPSRFLKQLGAEPQGGVAIQGKAHKNDKGHSALGPHGKLATDLRVLLTLGGMIEDQDANGALIDGANIKDAGVVLSRLALKQGGSVSGKWKALWTAWQLSFTAGQEVAKTPSGAAWARGFDVTSGVGSGETQRTPNLTVAQAVRQGAATGRLAPLFAMVQKVATVDYHASPRDTHMIIGSTLCLPLWILGMVGLIKDDVAKVYLPGGTKFTKAAFYGENGVGALQRFTGGGFMRKMERANYSHLAPDREKNRGFLSWGEIGRAFIHDTGSVGAIKSAWSGAMDGLTPAMAAA